MMKQKFNEREKIIILVVLIAIGIIINTIAPVSYKTSLSTQEPAKTAVSCGKTDTNILSALFVENNQKNENSCLFIGCGSAF